MWVVDAVVGILVMTDVDERPAHETDGDEHAAELAGQAIPRAREAAVTRVVHEQMRGDRGVEHEGKGREPRARGGGEER